MASMTLPELSVEDLDAPNPWSVTVLEYRQTARGVIGGLVEATRSDKDQLHSAAAEKWAVVDRLTSEAQMIRLTK